MKSDTNWVGKAIAGGMLKWIGFQIAALAGPAVLGLAAAAAGRMGGEVSWMWAISAGALSFGGAAAGVFFTLAVVDRYKVSGRLALASPRIALDLASGDVSLGVNLQSLAEVPIEFEIKEIRTQLSGTYASNKPFDRTTFEVPPHGVGFFSDYAIELKQGSLAGKVLDGSVIAMIAYGRPGSRKNVLNVKCGVHLRYGAQGSLEGTSWEMLA